MSVISSTKIRFKITDYTQFKGGYLFSLLDTERKGKYKLVYVPYSLYPSVLMLEHLMGSKEVEASTLEGMGEYIKDSLNSDSDSLIILGENREVGSVLVDELFDGHRVDNSNILKLFKTIDFHRDRENSLNNISYVAATRDSESKLSLGKVGIGERNSDSLMNYVKWVEATRETSQEGSKSDTELADRVQSFNLSKESISEYVRTNVFGMCSASMYQFDRKSQANADLSKQLLQANRDRISDAHLDLRVLDATRNKVLGELYKESSLTQYTRDLQKGYLYKLYQEVFDRDKVKGDLHIKALMSATKSLVKQASIIKEYSWGRLMARQYPAHVIRGGVGERLVGVMTELEAINSFERNITKGDMYLLKENEAIRDISSRMSLLRELPTFYRSSQAHAHIITSQVTLRRDIRALLDVSTKPLEGSRIYVVKAHVSTLDESERKTRAMAHIDRVDEYSREQKFLLGVSHNDAYARDTISGLYLQKPLVEYTRSVQSEATKETINSYVRSNSIQAHLEYGVRGVRDGKAKASLLGITSFKRDSQQQVYIDTKIGSYTRDIVSFMEYRQGLIESGGELLFSILDGLIMDEMLLGSLTEDYAYVMEYDISGDRPNLAGNITEDALIGAKSKIDALVEVGVLCYGDKNTKDGDILHINLDAVRDSINGELLEEKSYAIKEGQQPKQGWLENLDNPFGWIDARLGETDSTEIVSDRLIETPFDTNDAETLLGTVDGREAQTHTTEVEGAVDGRLGRTELETLTGSRKEVQATTTIDERAGSVDRRQGTYHHEEQSGHVSDRYGTVDTSLEGDKKDGEVDLSNLQEGLTESREGKVGEALFDGSVTDRQAHLPNEYSLGSKPSLNGDCNSIDYLGSTVDRSALSLEGNLHADKKQKLANTLLDFILANNKEREAVSFGELKGAIRSDKGAHLTEILYGKRDIAQAVVDSSIEGHSYKLGDIADSVLGVNEKNGVLEESLLGKGTLFDYNDDLIKESYDVEEWGAYYGYGVPDDYNPSDIFDKYYPRASSYAPYDMVQKVNWDKDSTIQFIPNTDEIEISSTTTAIAISELMGDNYKFGTRFTVQGSKDGAVDFIIKYQSEDNYLFFRVNGGDVSGKLKMNSPMQLYRRNLGTNEPIGYPMSPESWRQGEWHKIEVAVTDNGNRVQIWMDYKLQYDVRGY